jgi:endo-1,4-beta-xylanase
MPFHRRFIAMIAVLGGLILAWSIGAAGAADTLRDAAAGRVVAIGTAVTVRNLDQEVFRAVLALEFNQVEPENETKWGYLRPSRDQFRFDAGDRLAAFAAAHGMKFRGHCLAWHEGNPRWLTGGSFQPAELRALLSEHITNVARHFAGRAYAWDVVNEAFETNGTLRDSLWNNKPGIGVAGRYGFIEEAFRLAHAADPDALLFYNDYSAEVGNAKSDAIYAMVQDFKQRGVPIHGVGFQCHFEHQGVDHDQFLANLQRFAALGVQVQITELDVRLPLQPGSGPTPEQLNEQAGVYRQIAEACLAVPACTAIQTWGFTDRYSWVPGFFRNTGAALPFDADYKPKPAWAAWKSALEKR